MDGNSKGMTTQSFLIGPVKQGLRKETKPWTSPDDSFETLENAYQWRDRVVRRSGYTTLGRLANGTPVMGLRTYEKFGIGLQTLVAFDTTDAYEWDGTNFVVLPSVMPVTWSGTDYQFFYTINYANAFWATNNKPGLHGWNVSAFAGSAGVGNLATVQVTSAGNNVQVGDYVHFINLSSTLVGNTGVLAIVTIAGDPFTVQATNLPASSTFTWTNGLTATGMVLDSMQSITNRDGIRYYGDLSNGTGWANYNPPIDANNALAGALLMFPYRGYLVFLNTWEGNEEDIFNYGNRARWTQIGTPYYSEPVPVVPNPQTFDINAVRDDLFGRGGANDAPTNEVIVAAAFIRDILVVYFERSTWRLRFVNNAQNPFVWERVNIELGASCTFSSIPFDKGLMAIGNRGIVISDTNDTDRFDEKVPDTIFNIRQLNNGLERVYGIRTFRTKLNYWTYPSSDNPEGTYPDKVLVFNYDTKNWSFFDDCFTCFGYYYLTGTGDTWGDLTDDWSSYGHKSWDSGISQTGYENIVAGNQQGYVLLLQEPTEGNYCVNSPSLEVTNLIGNVVTSANNNLIEGTWIKLTDVTGTTFDDGVSLNDRNFKISKIKTIDPDMVLNEYKPVIGGNASGLQYIYQIDYTPIIPGSVQINIGADVYTDTNLDGILYLLGLPVGTIDYNSGTIIINFAAPIAPTQVNIRVVSLNPLQEIVPIATTGAYTGGGQITKISNIDIQTKIFNFFQNDQRARLSKIDFYTDVTKYGQFSVDIMPDSSNIAANQPLPDNPQSNVVLTSVNPYQIGEGAETLFRLYADVSAQTVQFKFYMSDAQMAVDAINASDIDISAFVVTMRPGGRLV